MKCCHPHAPLATEDAGFEADDFTRAALHERKVRAVHSHAAAFLLSLLGGVLFFGLIKSVHRHVR